MLADGMVSSSNVNPTSHLDLESLLNTNQLQQTQEETFDKEMANVLEKINVSHFIGYN